MHACIISESKYVVGLRLPTDDNCLYEIRFIEKHEFGWKYWVQQVRWAFLRGEIPRLLG
jgi:hypothetical protein